MTKKPPSSQASSLEVGFEELELLYRTAPLGLGVVDRELRFVRANEKLAEYAGLSAEEMLGRTTSEIKEPPRQSLMNRWVKMGTPRWIGMICSRSNPPTRRVSTTK